MKKGWHHLVSLSETSRPPVTFKRCPACEMIANHQYEGRIRISGVPERYLHDLMRFVHNAGERAFKKNPMHRVIAMKPAEAGWEITTTENRLANVIARNITRIFKGASMKAHFAGNPSDVEEITVTFQ
jgi:NMD protein affecting ribosome stability and mRNA decay